MIIKLRSYLANLEDGEQAAPPAQRRDVPTITALAKEAKVSRVQLQRVAGNDVKSVKLEIVGNIIKALRRRGFGTEVGDLLEYREEGEV